MARTFAYEIADKLVNNETLSRTQISEPKKVIAHLELRIIEIKKVIRQLKKA